MPTAIADDPYRLLATSVIKQAWQDLTNLNLNVTERTDAADFLLNRVWSGALWEYLMELPEHTVKAHVREVIQAQGLTVRER